jgi:hypothetical protein
MSKWVAKAIMDIVDRYADQKVREALSKSVFADVKPEILRKVISDQFNKLEEEEIEARHLVAGFLELIPSHLVEPSESSEDNDDIDPDLVDLYQRADKFIKEHRK